MQTCKGNTVPDSLHSHINLTFNPNAHFSRFSGRCPELGSTEWLHQAGVDSICPTLSPLLPLSLSLSLCRPLHTAAAHAIPVDLLMDLIAFQLIAPHASTKLNQTEAPSTSLIANLIPLDIIIRWYWLLMTQQFQNRWLSFWFSHHDMPRERKNCSGHIRVQVTSLGVQPIAFPLSICLRPSVQRAIFDALLHTELWIMQLIHNEQAVCARVCFFGLTTFWMAYWCNVLHSW